MNGDTNLGGRASPLGEALIAIDIGLFHSGEVVGVTDCPDDVAGTKDGVGTRLEVVAVAVHLDEHAPEIIADVGIAERHVDYG